MSEQHVDDLARVKRERAGLLIGLLGVIIFGGTLPATRLGLETFSPWFITFGRAVLTSIAAAILLAVLRKPFPRAQAIQLFATGVLLVFGFPLLSSIALQTVPASHGGVVLGILPLTTSIFAALIGGERPSLFFWACGVAGAALVILFAMRDGGMALSSGDIWLLLAGAAASLGYVFAGKLSQIMPGWEVICWALIVTLPISAIGAYLSYRPHFLEAPAAQIFAFLYLGLFSMFLGFFAWNIGLAMGGIARVSQVQLLQQFVTLAISAVMLGEHISGETLVFAFLVMLTVIVGRRARIGSTTGR